MIIYPAIDIKDGQCVRLTQGDFNQVTVYHQNPVDIAKKWEQAGASYIHVVDLDGAKLGTGHNQETIAKIAKSVQIPIQVGGGIRTLDHVRQKLDSGVARVILGTTSVTNPSFVDEAVSLFGRKIVAGVDAKNGKVAISGWEEVSDIDAISLCLTMKEKGVQTIIYTDIAKDGMMSGPNINTTKEIIDATQIDIIASGGVSCINDLTQVKQIGAHGAIVGKALYQQALSLEDIIEKFQTN